MYAITGITGRVGGIAARALLDAGEPVRAIVRGADKGAPWAAQGCEVALATASDAGGAPFRPGPAETGQTTNSYGEGCRISARRKPSVADEDMTRILCFSVIRR